jgi:hypothetical protein
MHLRWPESAFIEFVQVFVPIAAHAAHHHSPCSQSLSSSVPRAPAVCEWQMAQAPSKDLCVMRRDCRAWAQLRTASLVAYAHERTCQRRSNLRKLESDPGVTLCL